MRHSIVIEDFGIRLRPVRLGDAPFIVWVRNLDHAKGNIGDSATDIPTQENWLRKQLACDGDYYFLIESSRGIPVGTYGIYDVENGEGESGRWIVRPQVAAAIPSIVLAFEIAFHRLRLDTLRAHTVSTNHRVISLNRKLGFREVKKHPGSQVIDGQSVDLIQFELKAQEWTKIRESIIPMAQLAKENIRNWEQSAAWDEQQHSDSNGCGALT
jgi:RimJ/RimL family protein N-acetyltransferase